MTLTATVSRRFPTDLRPSAGLAVEDLGGAAKRVRHEYRTVQRLTAAPTAGIVLVQDEVTGEMGALAFDSLPTANPADGTVGNVKLTARPARTILGNQTGATSVAQDIPIQAIYDEVATPPTSAYDTDAYASGHGTGKAGFRVLNTDSSTASGKERYGFFGCYSGLGTGDPAVIGSSIGVGGAALKQGWQTSGSRGQMIGGQFIARGGYHGSDANAPLAEFGGYNPAGDTTAILANSVVSSAYSQNAILEGVAFYAPGGAFNNQVRGMNVQLGPMRQLLPDGSTANPGIGLALSAISGALGFAITANNTARAGSYAYAPGIWAGFLKYNFDDGVRAPFDAFRVDQDGTMYLSSGNATTPSKRIRAFGGNLEFLSHGVSVVHTIDDLGNVYMPAMTQIVMGGTPALNAPVTGFGAVTGTTDKTGFDAGTPLTNAQLTAKLGALWTALRAKSFPSA